MEFIGFVANISCNQYTNFYGSAVILMVKNHFKALFIKNCNA